MPKATNIRCVALRPLKVGGRFFDRPPAGNHGRMAQYMFNMPTAAAAALAKKQRLLPAYNDDAIVLYRETGYRIGSYMGDKAPKVGSEPAEAAAPTPEAMPSAEEPLVESEEEYSTEEESLLELALRTKKKADLVAALEEAGLDPADYSNNAERVEALEAL